MTEEEAHRLISDRMDKFTLVLSDHISQSVTGAVNATVARAIEKHVNEKIKDLSNKLEDYIQDSADWRSTVQPVIDMGKNVQGFNKVIFYFLGLISAVGGAILLFKELR